MIVGLKYIFFIYFVHVKRSAALGNVKVCLFIKSVREGADNNVDQFKIWFVTFLRFICCGAHLFTNWWSTCQQYQRCEIEIIF